MTNPISASDPQEIRSRKNQQSNKRRRSTTMTASFSKLGAPSILLLLLIWSTPSAHAFTQNWGVGHGVSSHSKASDNSIPDAEPAQDMSKKDQKKKSKRSVSYDLGSGQNKPLDHLRKNAAGNSTADSDATVGEMSYVDFWGAGYSQDSRSGSQKPRVPTAPQVYDKSSKQPNGDDDKTKSAPKKKKTARYDLGMNKNSPIVAGAERRRTRKLIAKGDDGEFLSRATGSGGTTSLSGLSRVEKGKDEPKRSRSAKATADDKTGERPPHRVDSWDEIEDDTKSSGLVGAHIDGGSTDPSSVPSTKEVEGDKSLHEHHVDDEAVEAAASAYVNALLHDETDIDDAEEHIHESTSISSSSDGPVPFEDIDLSVPLSVYDPDNSIDLVWDLMRYEANEEAIREPILVSFLHSTILNHPTLESALAFHLANKLSAPAMIATQIMTLIKEALDASPTFRRSLRADILAVRDRDPACEHLPDVFLYFKGFHSLESYRVANHLWKTGRTTLAHYLQSQVSQTFQIDIHPNATILEGVMLDHGTGIVIGETAQVGHNCSILHHVTLGGSGKKGVDRHPKVGNGVLLGAGCSALGNIRIGDGCQVGAGTLVIEDLPDHSVAVGVPARVIGTFVDVATQPARNMNQLGSKESDEMIQLTFESEGI